MSSQGEYPQYKEEEKYSDLNRKHVDEYGIREEMTYVDQIKGVPGICRVDGPAVLFRRGEFV